MTPTIKAVNNKLISLLGLDYVKFNNLYLPPRKYRFCGNEKRDDKYFLDSADNEVKKLVAFAGLNEKSKILDVGCGQGRLPLGILHLSKEINAYHGIDIDKRSIDWCKRYIEQKYPSFTFSLLNIKNERYNPKGKSLDEAFKFAFDAHQFNIIYLYSVFSHMLPADLTPYLKEFKRVLSPKGRIVFTTFVEDNVPDVVENPSNYKKEWEGPLHCVRYSKEYITQLVEQEGYTIDKFEYGTADDGQSVLFLKNNQID